MANVKKCDICGNVYENNGPEKTIEMYVYDKKNTTCNEYTSFEDFNHIDCCTACTERILGFVNVMKSSKH